MLRLMMCLFFLLGCGGYGVINALDFTQKYKEMVYIKEILSKLRLELLNKRATLGECCLIVSEELKEPYAERFRNIYFALEKEQRESLRNIWQKEMNVLAEVLRLKQHQRQLLSRCMEYGSGTCIDMPVEAVEHCLLQWENEIREAEKERKEKGKLSVCLGFSLGAFLCIVCL